MGAWPGRRSGLSRSLPGAEVDGEGVLGFGFLVCVFHLGGPPGFLGYATKTQFWVTKWGGMLYEVIIQYGGGKGKG